MPRIARILPEEGVFHVLTRGNNRQDTFHCPEDYQSYLEILKQVQRKHPFKIYHYCLMSNHVHLLLETISGSSLSVIMKKINLGYALYYKKRYRHVGHFWQDRFKSLLIEKDEYLLACAAYIELNPVKAGMVITPQEYGYSSYRFYFQGERSHFLSRNPLYEDLGVDEPMRRQNYQVFVESRAEDYEKYEEYMMQKKVLGSEKFLATIESAFDTVIARRPRGRPKRQIVAEK